MTAHSQPPHPAQPLLSLDEAQPRIEAILRLLNDGERKSHIIFNNGQTVCLPSEKNGTAFDFFFKYQEEFKRWRCDIPFDTTLYAD